MAGKFLIGLLTVGYPFAIYAGHGHLEPRWLAALLALIGGLRMLVGPRRGRAAFVVCIVVLLVATGVSNSDLPLKAYPVVVNAILLSVFAASLWQEQTLVERLARLREPALSPQGVRYTRAVTIAWCGFFVLNGSIAASTALWASKSVWALYTGLISYLMIGAFFGAEWLLRQRLRRRWEHG